MTKVKILWAYRYENQTTEEIEFKEGDNFKDLLSHLAPNELGECVDGHIVSVEDEEGNLLYEA